MDDKPNQPAATPSPSDSTSDDTGKPAAVDDQVTPTTTTTPSIKDRFASLFNRSAEKEDTQDNDTQDNDTPKPVPFLQLFKYSEPTEKLLLLFAVANAIIHGFLMPGFVILFGTIVNSFGTNTDQSQILDEIGGIAKWFLVLGAVAFVTGVFQVRFSLIFAQQVTNRIRNLYFNSLMRQDMTWYDSVETGELTARVSGDVNLLEDGIGSKIAGAVQFVTSFFVGIIVAFVYSWKLTLVVLSVSPFIMIGGALFARLSASGASDTLDSYASAGAIASEALSLVRTVTAFNGEETEAERYENKLQAAYVASVKKATFSGITVGFTYFVVFVAFGISFIYGGFLVRQGEVEGGDVLITFFAVFIATMSLGQAAPSFNSISNARGAAPKVYAVIDRVSEIDPSNETDGLQPDSFKGDIHFSSVKFNYPTRHVDDDGEARPYILDDFNLHVKAGSSHALVGPSGCGKSTTVRLIERFYDVSEGRLLLDGVDVRDYNVRWLRSQIGYVGQMPTLFMLSIRDNIAMGAADMNEVKQDDIVNAAKMANAHDFIMRLPQQYDTMLGERGALLSGGQKQRICIARALVRNPRILLLDESTSALDSQSERHVQEALQRAAQGRTTITIAHRLSTVKNADTISVIDTGRVKEEGTHAELINLGGVYNTLIENQKIAASKTEQESGGAAGTALSGEAAPTSVADSLTKGKSSTTKNAKGGEDEDEDDEEEAAVDKGIVARAFAYNHAEIPFVILGLIGAASTGAAWPLSAVAFGDVLEDIFLPDNTNAVRRAAVFFVLIGCMSFVGNIMQFSMLGISGGRLTRKLRGAMFRGLLKQEIGFFDEKKHSVGQLTTRLATEATLVQGLTGDTLGAMTVVISTLTTGILVAYLSCWRIALVITGLVPAVAFSEYAQVKLMAGFDADSASKFAAAGAVANEAVDNLTTVTSLGAQGYFIGRYLDELKKPLANGRRTSWISGVNFGFAELIVQTMWAIAFWVGAIFVRGGYCSFNELMKGVSGLLFAGSTLGQSAQFMPDFPKSQVAATKIFRFLDRVPKINLSGSVFRARTDMSGDVKADGIHFEYPTRPNVKVLRGLSLSALNGQMIALVGASGCGKSTIVSLIERFYDPRAGGIMVNGLDNQEYNISNLRSHLGLVSQEPDLFNRSVRDNIAYGLLGDDDETMVVTDSMIETAAKQANCHDFIMNLADKYDTIVGPRGERLSGGQRQRVAIARTLIRQPNVLLLDEATSALDSVAEQQVQTALQMAAENRTTIAIAHRLSTVKDADKICVIEKGRVVESGKHEQLMAKNGKYAKLVRNQVDQVEG